MTKKLPEVGDVIKLNEIKFEGPEEWVITDTYQEPGKTGISPNDFIPGGLKVTIQQLNIDGTYNEKGFIYKFHATGKYKDLIDLKDIKIVRKMKRIFV
jgi:hypothetical protein